MIITTTLNLPCITPNPFQGTLELPLQDPQTLSSLHLHMKQPCWIIPRAANREAQREPEPEAKASYGHSKA